MNDEFITVVCSCGWQYPGKYRIIGYDPYSTRATNWKWFVCPRCNKTEPLLLERKEEIFCSTTT